MMVGGVRKRRIRHFRNILAAACENILQKNNKSAYLKIGFGLSVYDRNKNQQPD